MKKKLSLGDLADVRRRSKMGEVIFPTSALRRADDAVDVLVEVAQAALAYTRAPSTDRRARAEARRRLEEALACVDD